MYRVLAKLYIIFQTIFASCRFSRTSLSQIHGVLDFITFLKNDQENTFPYLKKYDWYCRHFCNVRKNAEDSGSWDMISENDLWEGGNVDLEPDDYVLVGQEDIMDGIASFMAAYLLSLKQTKVRIIYCVPLYKMIII